MKIRILASEIRVEQDVVFVRQRAREIAHLLSFDRQDQTRIATAVSEIARNAYEYGHGGQVEFYVMSADQRTLQIKISDHGKGIQNQDSILDGQYQSKTEMGLGIIGAKRLMDVFRIESRPEGGTFVLLGKRLPSNAAAMTPERIGTISQELLRSTRSGTFGELQEQNQELIQALSALQEKQQELLQLNQELEDTNRGVVALYGELDEKAEALRKANEIKTRFLSNITHEFRTPLGSTVNLVEMLIDGLEGPLQKGQIKSLEVIRKSNEGLLELVNDLLDIAKVEAGRIPVRTTSFKMENLFSALRSLLDPVAKRNPKVTLEFEKPEGFPILTTDEGKVTQIFRNLISNAIKYTESGHVQVRARVMDVNLFAVEVADTGIGIAQGDQDRIFEEFTQIESSLQKRYKGSGLGLALVKKLTHLLGGVIKMESELGKGSVFSVTLPIQYTGPKEGDYI